MADNPAGHVIPWLTMIHINLDKNQIRIDKIITRSNSFWFREIGIVGIDNTITRTIHRIRSNTFYPNFSGGQYIHVYRYLFLIAVIGCIKIKLHIAPDTISDRRSIRLRIVELRSRVERPCSIGSPVKIGNRTSSGRKRDVEVPEVEQISPAATGLIFQLYFKWRNRIDRDIYVSITIGIVKRHFEIKRRRKILNEIIGDISDHISG